ncbi:MAG: hypothetical protein FD180_1759 [Planctomycetota bacterium]|nr:MAG: hypothetical protein FD180_1759 [Planctomycetota bacterium]
MKRFLVPALALAIIAGCGKDDSSSSSSGGSSGGSTSSGASQKTPEEAFKDMQARVLAKDGKGLWNCICEKSRKKMTESDEARKQMDQLKGMPDEQLGVIVKDMGVTPAEFKKLSNEEIMLLQMNQVVKEESEQKKARETKWKEAKIDGDKAIATTIEADGKEEKAALVKEGGTWKIDIEETDKLKEK